MEELHAIYSQLEQSSSSSRLPNKKDDDNMVYWRK